MKATDKSKPISRTEQDEWLRTFYEAATPAQRAVLRDILEQLGNAKEMDEVSIARLRKRFGKPSAQLRAALDALSYRQAVERRADQGAE
jgi:ribosomal protein S24E